MNNKQLINNAISTHDDKLTEMNRNLFAFSRHFKEAGFKSNRLLHLAVKTGSIDIVTSVIENKPKLEITDHDGNNALHLAAELGNYEIVELLINKGIKPNDKNYSGDTPLSMLLQKTTPTIDQIKTIESLLNNGAKLNQLNDKGEVDFHYAIFNYPSETLQKLIDFGADLNKSDNDNYKAIHIAAAYGTPQSVELLINSGANPDEKLSDGQTPLFLTIRKRNTDTLEKLIELGSDINAKDKYNRTPLIYSTEHTSWGTVTSKLVAKGALLDEQDKDKMTAMHHAAMRKNYDDVQILIENGADSTIENNNGKVPFNFVHKGNRKIVNLLEKSMEAKYAANAIKEKKKATPKRRTRKNTYTQ